MSWSEAQIDSLKKLWSEGHSASQIAIELGQGITRNSVIGKVHRLKLAKRKATYRAEPKSKKRLARRERPAIAVKRVPQAKRPMLIHRPNEREFVSAPLPKAEDVFIPLDQRIGVMGLTEHTCKWPIGDPCEPDFHFCGQHKERTGPYCEHHSKRAFVPAPPIKINGKRK